MKHRPLGVVLLAILAGLGAVNAIVHTLQYLHILPLFFGPLGFFTFDVLGAIVWGVLALMYLWLVRMLWNVNPQAWLFLLILSTINLIMAAVSILGKSSWQAMLPTIVIHGIILIYLLLPRTKQVFGQS